MIGAGSSSFVAINSREQLGYARSILALDQTAYGLKISVTASLVTELVQASVRMKFELNEG